MKIHIYPLVLFVSLFLACSQHTMSPLPPALPSPAAPDVSALYRAAAAKHYQLANGEVPSTEAAWHSLIAAFQRTVDADAEGVWADDAQYAIASCWLWLGQENKQPALDNAVAALKKLLQDYPNSSYTVETHYWLGGSYDQLGNYGAAVTHYQKIISRYPSHSIADKAQLRLGRMYEAQGHFILAHMTYKALAQQSKNTQIVAQAEIRASRLDIEQTAEEVPVDSPPEIASPEPTPVAQSNPTKSPSSEPVKSPKPVDVSPSPPPKETDVEPKTVTSPSEAKPITQKSSVTDKQVASPRKAKPAAAPLKMPRFVADPSLAQQLGLNVKTIVIDPGHGGKDPGAVRHTRQEKQIVLSLSKMLRDLLVKKGYNVKLTRETDIYIPIRKRAQFATDQKADLFISIHANASNSHKATGIETYYLALASDESARITAMRENVGAAYNMKELDTLVRDILEESKSVESRRLAHRIQARLTFGKPVKNRGVKRAPFVVLIGPKVPAVLVEIGFISNPTEGKKLTTKAYQRQLATSIAEGIEQYIKSFPLASANRS